jgi:mono/diheme cytochrome c family protein
MKLLFKVLGGLLVLALLAAGAGAAYLKLAFPKVGPAPQLQVVATPEAVARGAYLANHVSACMDCHSKRDWTKFAGPLVPGTLGQGGEVFDQSMGLPGRLFAKNLTPAALASWTDGESLRACTTGVTKDGHAMFPLMPYPAYGRMAKQDAEAIVAYLRQLAPIENAVPDSELDFPLNLIVGTIPHEAEPQPLPDRQNTLA